MNYLFQQATITTTSQGVVISNIIFILYQESIISLGLVTIKPNIFYPIHIHTCTVKNTASAVSRPPENIKLYPSIPYITSHHGIKTSNFKIVPGNIWPLTKQRYPNWSFSSQEKVDRSSRSAILS